MKALGILENLKEYIEIESRAGDLDYSHYSVMIDYVNESIEELQELENRNCSNCKYVYIDTLGFNYCENPISPLSSCIFALHPSFCCNKWENKQ